MTDSKTILSNAAPTESCASCVTGVQPQPLEGNYFVAAYPPFSVWTPHELPAVEQSLQTGSRAPDRAMDGRGGALAPFGLYIHIPFCVKRCLYCYYLAYDDRPAAVIDAYLDALPRELALYAQCPALRGRKPDFVYFGGGTPSLLSRRRIEKLLERLQSEFRWNEVREVTFECAPQSVTVDKLRVLRGAGVTRISLGVQQLDDEVLLTSGRVHTVRDVCFAYDAIRAIGFPVVNLDLIAGLPGETEASFLDSLERVVAMQPESITIYPLEIPQYTPLYRLLRSGSLEAPLCDWETKYARLSSAFTRLETAGYTVRSAYAAVRDPVRHRFVYQDEQYRGADLLGVGAASFSYIAGVHFQNLSAIEPYLDAVQQGRAPRARARVLTDEERLVREFVLQLKLGRVACADFRERFGIDPLQRFAAPLARLAAAGVLSFDSDRVRMTRDGRVRADRIVPEFYLPQHRGVRYN